MSDSPWNQYGTLDPEFAAFWQGSLQRPNLEVSNIVEGGRKLVNEVFVPMLREQTKHQLPDGK